MVDRPIADDIVAGTRCTRCGERNAERGEKCCPPCLEAAAQEYCDPCNTGRLAP